MSTIGGRSIADYEAADILVVTESEQLRALADDLRMKILMLLRERAASTSELADFLGLPKGTVGHHLKVLEQAGLVRVVRTRRVRAVTEKYFGRVARLFVVRAEDEPEGEAQLAAALLRRAADEVAVVRDVEGSIVSLLHIRLAEDDAGRLIRRLEKLLEEMRSRDTPAGRPLAFVVGLYPAEQPDA